MPEADETWTRELVAEVFDAASAPMKEILLLLAASPGDETSAQELAKTLDSNPSRIAGIMGSFSNMLYRRWGLNTAPFTTRRYVEGQTYYSMTPEIAAVIGMRDTADPAE